MMKILWKGYSWLLIVFMEVTIAQINGLDSNELSQGRTGKLCVMIYSSNTFIMPDIVIEFNSINVFHCK